MYKKTLLIISILIVIFTITFYNKSPYIKKYKSIVKENKESISCNINMISFTDNNNKYNIKVEDNSKVRVFLVNTLSKDIKNNSLDNILYSDKLNSYSKKYPNVVIKEEELNINNSTTIDYTKYYNKSNMGYDYIVVDVILNKGKSTCYSRKIKQIPIFDSTNPYSDLCNNIINEDIKNIDQEEFKKYKESLSLCKNNNSLITSKDNFLESLNNAEQNYLLFKKVNDKKEEENKNIGNKDLYENIDNPKNTPQLTCKVNSVYFKDIEKEDKLENITDNLSLNSLDKSLLVEGNIPKANLYQFKHTEEKDYKYKVYEQEKVKEEKNACKVSCTEYLKVNFDPPQNVKAGMCFGYAVEVISTTTCNTKVESPPDVKYSNTIAPSCTENKTWKKSTEENEEFLSCINKCSGKHDLNCSKKCLNESYGITNSPNTRVGLDLSDNTNKDKCKYYNEVPGIGENNIDVIYNFFKKHSSGYYKKDNNGKLKFISNYPGCYWASYSPWYYTDSGIKYLKEHDAHFAKTNKMVPSCSIGGRCDKEIEDGGFMTSYKEDSCDLREENPNCKKDENINCSWISSNKLNAEEVLKDYNLTSKSYRDSISLCNADAKTKTTKTNTSKFYISIENDNNTTSWTDTNTTSDKECVLSSNNSIIEGKDTTDYNKTPGTGGLAYCNNKDYGDWHHYTRWTFPGSWIDKKTGKITDTPPTENDIFYRGGYGKYCLPKDSKEINTSWAEEYESNLEKTNTDKDARIAISNAKVDNFNIVAKATNFGNYGWNINTRCFYSLKREETNEGE